ncbi:MAG: ribosome-associated translation inhibitor RaiA [Spirochaetes bacterium]|nr:ribosome-associated translation inhibitor RaiA [Spirochaetota bacterium]
MKIKITARKLDVSKNLREYAEKKFSRLEKYFHQLIDAHIIFSIDKLDHVAEIIVNGDGVQFYGIEKSGDMYSSIDLLIDKLEKQVVKYKEKHSSHKVTPLNQIVNLEEKENIEKQIRINQVSHKPLDGIGAYLEMKLNKMDFIIFKQEIMDAKADLTNYVNKNYAILYKEGESIKMVEIPFKLIQKNNFDPKKFLTYTLEVKSDSPVNPDIKFKKTSGCDISAMTTAEALKKLEEDSAQFIPFFNSETKYFNVIYRRGNNIELMVPAM